MNKNEKKTRRFPDTYVIVFCFICIAAILTYIVPAGTYDSVMNEATGKTAIDPNSFHYIDSNPTSVMEFLTAIPRGLVKGNSMIFLILLVGGFFQVVNDTGALDKSLSKLMQKLGKNELLLLPIIMIIMAILGATGVVINAVLAFVPLGMILARKLRLDPIVAIAMTFGACYVGFSASPMCPLTLQYAQNLAGVEPLSNFGFRSVIMVACLAAYIIFTYRYCQKIRNDITKSYVYGFEFDETASFNDELTWRDLTIVGLLIAGLAVYTYGTIKLSWATDTLPATLLVVALLSGAIAGIHPNDIVKSFVNGCKAMVYSGVLIGIASAIAVILTDGGIIHTIINACAKPMSAMGETFGGIFLYIFNTAVNLFIPSGSGQAAVVIPILSPLCEVVGISKEVMISAFKYGDGFSNTIFPTISVLMGCCGVAKIDYPKWLKFQLPIYGIISVIVIIGLVVGTMMGI